MLIHVLKNYLKELQVFAGGETINEFYLRAEAFINRVAAAHPGGKLPCIHMCKLTFYFRTEPLYYENMPLVTLDATSFSAWRNMHLQQCSEKLTVVFYCEVAMMKRCCCAGQLVIVVTHGGFLSVLHRACVGHSKGGIVMNCSIGEVHANSSSGARAVVKWNDTSHLSSAGGNPLPTKPGVL